MRVFKQKFKKVDEFRTTEVKFPKTYQRKKKIKNLTPESFREKCHS